MQFDVQSLRDDGSFDWYAPSGQILSTDVRTGRTTTRFDTGVVYDPSATTNVVFDPDSVHVLHEPGDGESELTYTEFDRASGEVRRKIQIPGIAEKLGVDLVLRGFAVRPD